MSGDLTLPSKWGCDIIAKLFGQKFNSNLKSHENQFYRIMYGGELSVNYMLAESFAQKIDSNLKPH